MGQIMIKYHWEWLNDEDNKWMLPAILDKGVPRQYIEKPDDETIQKIDAMYNYMKGSRNSVLLVCNRTAYVNAFFYYFGLTWLTTTNKLFDIIDLGNIKADPKLYNTLEHSSLVMVPHVSTGDYTLRDVRDRIGSILIKRQVKNMPTIIELYSRVPAQGLKKKDLTGLVQALSSIYGESCAGSFLDQTSNVKVVTVK